MLAPNVTLQGRYRIIRPLGKGGMGAVYEALNEPVCSIVALKETFAETAFEQRAFVREARLLANLDHEAFPRVIDHFFEDGGQYLVMEFVRGNDFAELLQLCDRPFEPEKVLEWADQLLDALEELHAHPIIHRDIKPSNLKLTRRSKIKLLDFGIAKGTLEPMTRPGTEDSLGAFTLQYAPIEQALRASPHWVNVLRMINAEETEKILSISTDARTDIYSLGATLYHLLTNETPTNAPTRAIAVWTGRPDPLLPINKINPLVSPVFAHVLSQAMSLDSDARPASATELRYLLRQINKTLNINNSSIISDSPLATVQTPIIFENLRNRLMPTGEHNSKIINSNSFEQKQKAFLHDSFEEEITALKAPIASNLSISSFGEKRGESSKLYESTIENEKLNQSSNTGSPAKKVLSVSTGELFPSILKYADERTIRRRSHRARILGAGAIVLALTIATLFLQRTDLTPRGAAESSKETPRPSLASSISGLIFSPNHEQSSNSFANVDSLPLPKNMTLVPGGTFVMGRDGNGAEGTDAGERPAHKTTLKPFLMDIYEVTNQDYALYLKATGRKAPDSWNKQFKSYESGKDLYPVTGVNWAEANAYCQNYKKRLPTEAEWEFAARGNDNRLYPWGNEWRDGMANANNVNNSPTEVGRYTSNSPFGMYDMVGNAWEWTASVMKAYPNGEMPANQPRGKLRVIRGGTYDSNKQFATATYRTGWPEKGASTYAQTSFRCAQDVIKTNANKSNFK